MPLRPEDERPWRTRDRGDNPASRFVQGPTVRFHSESPNERRRYAKGAPVPMGIKASESTELQLAMRKLDSHE